MVTTRRHGNGLGGRTPCPASSTPHAPRRVVQGGDGGPSLHGIWRGEAPPFRRSRARGLAAALALAGVLAGAPRRARLAAAHALAGVLALAVVLGRRAAAHALAGVLAGAARRARLAAALGLA